MKKKCTHVIPAVLISLMMNSTTFGADNDGTTTNSSPLTVKSLSGIQFTLNNFPAGTTVSDIKKQVADGWNVKFGKSYTQFHIHLFGSDKLVGGNTGKLITYHDQSLVSTDQETLNAVKMIDMSIMNIIPTFTEANPTPLTARSLSGYKFPLSYFHRNATILDIKKHIAGEWNAIHGIKGTEEDIQLHGSDLLVGGTADKVIPYYNHYSISMKPETFEAVKTIGLSMVKTR